MAKLTIHDPAKTREELELERKLAYARLPGEEKWRQLMELIALSIKLNGGKPLKEPQGKGIVIRKPKSL